MSETTTYVAVGQVKFDREGNQEGTIIGTTFWPERVADAGMTDQWMELVLIPAVKKDRDWSLLEATQGSLREHARDNKRLEKENDRLRARVKELESRESNAAPDLPEGYMLFPVKAWRFLCGEDHLEGKWFGDIGIDGISRYWWRRAIKGMLTETPQETEKQREQDW